MAARPPSCTSCGRELKAHCTHCTWWGCSNRVCGVERHDFRRGIRLLTTGTVEPIPRPT